MKIEECSDDDNCKDANQKDYLDKTDETSFLRKLHEFMTNQKTPIPKSVWFSLKNGEYFILIRNTSQMSYNRPNRPKIIFSIIFTVFNIFLSD